MRIHGSPRQASQARTSARGRSSGDEHPSLHGVTTALSLAGKATSVLGVQGGGCRSRNQQVCEETTNLLIKLHSHGAFSASHLKTLRQAFEYIATV